jgi:hypothetical protein
VSDIIFFNTSQYFPKRVSFFVTKNSEISTSLSTLPVSLMIVARIFHSPDLNKSKVPCASTNTTPATSSSSKSKSSKSQVYLLTYTLALALS